MAYWSSSVSRSRIIVHPPRNVNSFSGLSSRDGSIGDATPLSDGHDDLLDGVAVRTGATGGSGGVHFEYRHAALLRFQTFWDSFGLQYQSGCLFKVIHENPRLLPD